MRKERNIDAYISKNDSKKHIFTTNTFIIAFLIGLSAAFCFGFLALILCKLA